MFFLFHNIQVFMVIRRAAQKPSYKCVQVIYFTMANLFLSLTTKYWNYMWTYTNLELVLRLHASTL